MQELEFNVWLDAMRKHLAHLIAGMFDDEPSINQPTDEGMARLDYAEGKTPEASAKLFVDDWYK